jgi:hypothetical protein
VLGVSLDHPQSDRRWVGVVGSCRPMGRGDYQDLPKYPVCARSSSFAKSTWDFTLLWVQAATLRLSPSDTEIVALRKLQKQATALSYLCALALFVARLTSTKRVVRPSVATLNGLPCNHKLRLRWANASMVYLLDYRIRSERLCGLTGVGKTGECRAEPTRVLCLLALP